MLLEPPRPPVSRYSLRWIVGNILVAAVVLVGVARIWSNGDSGALSRPTAACPVRGSLPEVKPYWFEDEREIYHEIPARVRFRLASRDGQRAEAIACLAWAEFERIGAIFNAFSAASEVSRFNQRAGSGCQPVSNDLFEVVRLSRILWKESQGRFDPTVWPLKGLWHSAVLSQRVPDSAALAAVLSHMGFNKVQVCALGRSLRLDDSHTKVEFGAIAKGYAVDQVKRVLESEGALSGLVQLGGEIACFGPPSGQRWRLGIQHPKEGDQLWATISNRDGLRVSTSGNYRQPLQIGSQSYYHIFDPTTGLPVSERILGVTTADLSNRANNSMLDGAATAITVLGVNKGLALAKRLGIEVLILIDDEQAGIVERMTDGLYRGYERKVSTSSENLGGVKKKSTPP